MPRVIDIRPRILPRDVGGPGIAEGLSTGLELLRADRQATQDAATREQERREDRQAIIDAIQARGTVGQELAVTTGGQRLEELGVRGGQAITEIGARGAQQRETLERGFELEAPQLEQANIFETERIGIAREGRELQRQGLEADIEQGQALEEGRMERARMSQTTPDQFPLSGLAAAMINRSMVTTTGEAISVARGRDPNAPQRTPIRTEVPSGRDTVEQFQPRPGGLIQSVEEARLIAQMPAEDHVEIGLALLANPDEFDEYLDLLPDDVAAEVRRLVQAAARNR